MKNLELIILFAFLLILFVPISLKLKMEFNLLINCGKFKVFFLKKIKVIDWKFELIGKSLKITKRNGKIKYYSLVVTDIDFEFIASFQKALFNRLNIKKSSLLFFIGAKNNAFLTSMLTGYITVIINSILAYLKTHKNGVSLSGKVNPNYEGDIVKMQIQSNFALSIVGLMASLIEAKIKKNKKSKKVGKNYVKQQRI